MITHFIDEAGSDGSSRSQQNHSKIWKLGSIRDCLRKIDSVQTGKEAIIESFTEYTMFANSQNDSIEVLTFLSQPLIR